MPGEEEKQGLKLKGGHCTLLGWATFLPDWSAKNHDLQSLLRRQSLKRHLVSGFIFTRAIDHILVPAENINEPLEFPSCW
jgi:hypothetical protein